MKGYKGFSKGLVCLGKQYAENTVFEEKSAKICSYGMHFCENPFDVLDHYSLLDKNGEFNEFAEVEALAGTKTDDNKKFCTTKLKIGAKLSFAGFVKACIDFTMQKTKCDSDCCSEKDCAKLASSGNDAKLASSGNYAKLASSGNDAKLASSGNYAKLASSGNDAKLASSGYGAQLASSGENSVLCCAGINARCKAKKGSWITLAEWEYDNKKNRYIPICVKTERVDGERIKEDVFYTIKNGEFVEC